MREKRIELVFFKISSRVRSDFVFKRARSCPCITKLDGHVRTFLQNVVALHNPITFLFIWWPTTALIYATT